MAKYLKYKVKCTEPNVRIEACRFETTAANTTFDWASEGINSLSEVSTGVYRVTLHNTTPAQAVVVASVSLPDAVFADDEYGCWVAQDDIKTAGTFDIHCWKGTASGVQNLTDCYVNAQVFILDSDIYS